MAASGKKSGLSGLPDSGGAGKESDGPVRSFEDKMKRLDEIVRAMEQGDRPLEESLALFEEGMKLSSECQTLLEEAERKVTLLLSGTGREVESGSDEGRPVREVPFRRE
ncbi:MAG: exodeoxyribonuclease VII small subunit [Nitrospirota bacterium]|nr:exodeoxyribonuclease VII small subunit [Nitrospirota bacterium]